MKLLEIYSNATDLKIGSQDLIENFYPLPFEKYITFHCGSGMQAKNYPYWYEVSILIRKILQEHGISIVVVGSGNDFQLQGCHNLVGKTDIHQTNYILKNSLLHCSNDTWTAHRAGYLNIPLVEIFGSTTIENHSPYVYNKEKSIFIESHRFGHNASFQSQEMPQTIALIPPEQIANAIFELLGIEYRAKIESLVFGPLFQQVLIELVPNCVFSPQFQIPSPLVIRMDYLFDEKFLFENLKFRQCIIITDKEINLNLLASLKKNVKLLRVEVSNVSRDWLKNVTKLGIDINFLSLEKNSEKLRKKRLELINILKIEQTGYPTKNEVIQNIKVYTNKEIPENFDVTQLKFKTNKFIFSENKFYLSKAHWKSGISTENTESNFGSVIDSEDFWMDQNHFYFYKTKE